MNTLFQNSLTLGDASSHPVSSERQSSFSTEKVLLSEFLVHGGNSLSDFF